MKKTSALRALLARPGLIIAPGVYDALSARICEMVGFEAVSHSGYGTAAVTLGQPDIGLLDMTEMVRQVRSVANAVEIPVLGDADTGFGNAVNVYRTVQEYLRAGAAGLFIEDQLMPKRCGHMRGKQVVSMAEMLGKLRAAMDARAALDPQFVIMCRIDSIAVHGFADALDRAKAAVDAGVDMIFVEALETREQMERVGREVKAPLMLNLIEGGRTPLITYTEAEQLGFKYVVPALTALSAAAKGMYEVMRRVKDEGVSNAYSIDSFLSRSSRRWCTSIGSDRWRSSTCPPRRSRSAITVIGGSSDAAGGQAAGFGGGRDDQATVRDRRVREVARAGKRLHRAG